MGKSRLISYIVNDYKAAFGRLDVEDKFGKENTLFVDDFKKVFFSDGDEDDELIVEVTKAEMKTYLEGKTFPTNVLYVEVTEDNELIVLDGAAAEKAANQEAVNAAIEEITADALADVDLTEATDADDAEEAVIAAIEELIDDENIEVTLEVGEDGFTAPEGSTAGSFEFKVTLTKGTGATKATATTETAIELEIPAAPVDDEDA